jgi:hypothetical protein
LLPIQNTWGPKQVWYQYFIPGGSSFGFIPMCIVLFLAVALPNPANGKTANTKQTVRRGGYLFPKRALSLVFRAKFMAALRKRITVPQHIAKQAFQTKWVVYAKRPFASPKTVVEYLGRYTHKVAISNHRLVDVDEKGVTFHYKDYRDAAKQKQGTMSGVEFLRRFADHILPHGFVRIRHYGFLASKNKPTELNLAKKELGQPEWSKIKYSWHQIAQEKLNYNPDRCPHCQSESLMIIKLIDPERGPPKLKHYD